MSNGNYDKNVIFGTCGDKTVFEKMISGYFEKRILNITTVFLTSYREYGGGFLCWCCLGAKRA
ncbi:MAG: hypothetical protein LBG58_04095 [Planctomycetaceae bacterium]|jgi:hypothetical protein|nr:hypothetical protein [Planctomycetaceae bacterium]